MNVIRAFIALDLPARSRDLIQQQTAFLRNQLGNELIRWVPAENIHLTIKFLGEISNAHLTFLKQMITQTAESCAPFDVQIGGLGCYPNPRAPRVIWIGLHAPQALSSLQKNIEAGAVRLGYEAENRAFSPHLTIGRLRQNAPSAELPKIRSALNAAQLGKMDVVRMDAIHLFKSELTPNGSIYTKLFSASFGKTAG